MAYIITQLLVICSLSGDPKNMDKVSDSPDLHHLGKHFQI
jgi:hypothetical protein